jgi:anti-sigma-K factor RskA
MSDDTHVLDLLPAYVIGGSGAEESHLVEEHLLSCWICRAELADFQDVLGQLSLAVPAVIPPADLKDRLLQRVQTARPQQPIPVQRSERSWLARLLPVWGLASFALIIILGIFNVSLWQRINHLEFLTSPGGMRAVPLSSPEAASRATGFVLISADGDDGALVVDGLPPLGENQQYQVWLIRDGQRTSGAVFSTDEKSYGGTRIEVSGSLLEYSAVGITIEPSGGSPQPTGTKVLGGQLFNP